MPSTSDDLAYSLDPVLWAQEVLGYHPDPWQADLLRGADQGRSSSTVQGSAGNRHHAPLWACMSRIYRRPSFGLVIAPTQDQILGADAEVR